MLLSNIPLIAIIASYLGVPATAGAPRIGETYEITLIREMSGQSSDGSTSSSFDKDTIVERVINLHEDGVELEYDLPKSSKNEEAKDWKFPVRVLRPQQGPLRLLNRSELEGRVDEWLRKAKWTREVCGRWIFTWNAFRIECEPEAAVAAVEAFDLTADLQEGATFREEGALSTGTLKKQKAGAEAEIFTVQMEVDPDFVRRARAESDVAVGEMLQKPVTLEAALRKRASDSISGTISITFETDAMGTVQRRTKVTKLQTLKVDGPSETETVTQTLERRRIVTECRGMMCS